MAKSFAATLVVSPSGDDRAAGDASAPFHTIGHASQLAMPGDTILVRAGVYRERVAPPRGGQLGKPITYQGEQLGRFIGNKRYEHAGIKCHGMRDGLIERNYIADNPLNDGVWLDNQFPGTRVTRNVIVSNGVQGIFLEMSDYDWALIIIS